MKLSQPAKINIQTRFKLQIISDCFCRARARANLLDQSARVFIFPNFLTVSIPNKLQREKFRKKFVALEFVVAKIQKVCEVCEGKVYWFHFFFTNGKLGTVDEFFAIWLLCERELGRKYSSDKNKFKCNFCNFCNFPDEKSSTEIINRSGRRLGEK